MNDLRIKKRKPGKCSWCGDLILVGSEFIWWPSVDDDGVPNGSCSMHPECNQAYKDSYRETFSKFVWERGKISTKSEVAAQMEKESEIADLKWAWNNRISIYE